MMISELRTRALPVQDSLSVSGAGLCCGVGQQILEVSYVGWKWVRIRPGEQSPDGLILPQPWSRGLVGYQVKETIIVTSPPYSLPSPDGWKPPSVSPSKPSSEHYAGTAPSTSKPATPSSPPRPHPRRHPSLARRRPRCPTTALDEPSRGTMRSVHARGALSRPEPLQRNLAQWLLFWFLS